MCSINRYGNYCACIYLIESVKMALQSSQKRSSIWAFSMTAENTKFAKCSVCLKEVPCGGHSTKSYTTTNLVNHLKSKHPGVQKLRGIKSHQSKRSIVRIDKAMEMKQCLNKLRCQKRETC